MEAAHFMAEHSIDLTEEVSRDLVRVRPAHPWFAVRPPTLGRAAVILTLLRSPERFNHLYGVEPDSRILAREAGLEDSALRVLDVFAGTSSIAGEAALLGCVAESVELNPVAHFIGHCTWELPKIYGREAAALGWRGLKDEVAEAARSLWRATSARIAPLFPAPDAVNVWVERGPCPQCGSALTIGDAGSVAPQLRGLASDNSPARGRVHCTKCGAISSTAAIRTGRTALQLVAVADSAKLVAGDDLRSVENSAASAEAAVNLLREGLRAPEPRAIDPGLGVERQAAVVLTLLAELRAVRTHWGEAARDPHHTQALLDCLALCISATSSLARRDGRVLEGGRFLRSSRLGQYRPTAFAEPSLTAWHREWSRRVDLLLDQIERARNAPGRVHPHLADAADLPFEDESFDAVICDPPYFDNVQYGDESRPFHGWLRIAVSDAHPELFAREALSDDAQVIVRGAEADRGAERERYGTLLTTSVEEAARVLAPDRCLSFVFTARDADQLTRFLRQVQPQGLELVDAIRVAQPHHGLAAEDAEAGSYILLFRKSRVVTSVDEPSVDADVVLDLATLGRSKLYAAVAEILEAEWDDETAEATIPAGFQGLRSQQIQELVAGHADPASLLAELGAPTLRRHAERLDVPEDDRRASATGLAEAILRAVGFSVPSRPRFTSAGQRSEAARCAAELRIASTLDEVRGLFLTGSAAVERAVRYGTIAWVQAVSASAWLEALERLFSSVRDKRFAGPGFFSFGDWQAVLFAIPRLQEETTGPLHARLAALKRALGKRGAQGRLERLLKVRNLVEHDTDGFLAGPFAELREAAADALAAGVSAMDTLMSTGSWPQVLQPLDERRDRFDRLTLRMLDEQNTTVELFVDHPTDLTRPYLWFRGGSNPREVEPLLLPLDAVTRGCDLKK
jgi:putative DNA methylase